MKGYSRFIIITAVISVLMAGTVLTAGCLKEGQLLVQDMNVGAESITSSFVTLTVTSSLQNNNGVGSDPLDIRLRAFNTDSGFLETEQNTTIPGIEWGGTRSVSQTVVLPRKGSYRLVTTVYRGDQFRGQGEITVSNLEQLTPDIQQSGLIIEDMDFIVKKVTGTSALIQTDIYVANGGKGDSGPVRIEVKAKEMDAHLTADKQQAEIPSIGPEKIGVGSVSLTVPDQYNYIVEALIWKNGTIVKRGEGVVQLRPGVLVSNGSQIVGVKIDTSKFVAREGQMAASPYSVPPTRSPGFASGVTLLSLAAIGVLMITARRRR